MTELPTDALRVVATIPTEPEAATKVRAGLTELLTATRAEEGCLAYDFFESQSAPGTFIAVEAWRSQADLDAHMATPHIAAAFELLGPSLTGEVQIHPLAPLT